MQTAWSDGAEYFLTRNFSDIQEIELLYVA